MTALLSVTNLSVEYRSLGRVNHAVSDVSFSIDRGEVVGMVGEGGSGKSTAALAVLGLTRQSGHIMPGASVKLDGVELLGASDSEWRKVRGVRIGLVTQNPRGSLSPIQRIGDSIVNVYRAHADVTKQAAVAHALDLLRAVGINDPKRRLEAFPHELSGGMAQRVVIAMGLACGPDLLLADEPTSGLDVTVQAQVLDDLRNAARQTGSSLLVITQDLGIVAHYAERVYMMHAGEVIEESPKRTFFSDPSSPASVALLAAQRGVDSPALRLVGRSQGGTNLPNGCWLSRRCPFAREEDGCHTVHPPLTELSPGHLVRCHRHETVREAAAQIGHRPDDVVLRSEDAATDLPTLAQKLETP